VTNKPRLFVRDAPVALGVRILSSFFAAFLLQNCRSPILFLQTGFPLFRGAIFGKAPSAILRHSFVGPECEAKSGAFPCLFGSNVRQFQGFYDIDIGVVVKKLKILDNLSIYIL
jgi:hypothetical protein